MMKLKLYNCLAGKETPQSEYALGVGYLKSNCTGADIQIVTHRSQLMDCDMIGLSATTGGIPEALEILEASEVPVIIGGQCTLWDPLMNYPFRYIIKGEGERALQAIIDYPPCGKVQVIRGENIENLDDLNYPDRGRCNEVLPILTSRGCPWNCHFCSSQKYWGKPRYHSAKYFINEVNHLVHKYPTGKLLYIQDDLFIANKFRFEEIYEYWMTMGFHRVLQLQGFVRSNLMTLDMAKKMKRMGFRRVRFGAESGSDRILKLLNKQTTVADHQRCIDLCNEAGLTVVYSMIFYPPGETVHDRRLTRQFMKKNEHKAGLAGNYAFRPFPGTKYYNGESPLEGDWSNRTTQGPMRFMKKETLCQR